MDFLGAVGKPGGHGIQGDRQEEEHQGRDEVKHGYSPYYAFYFIVWESRIPVPKSSFVFIRCLCETCIQI